MPPQTPRLFGSSAVASTLLSQNDSQSAAKITAANSPDAGSSWAAAFEDQNTTSTPANRGVELWVEDSIGKLLFITELKIRVTDRILLMNIQMPYWYNIHYIYIYISYIIYIYIYMPYIYIYIYTYT